MRCCGVETLACLSLLRFPLFNTWGDTINTWRFPSNSTQCTDGLHAVTFRTPLIHSLGHTELLNCVKLYSMYESCYLHKLYNLGLHPWSANGTAEVFIILRLKTAGDTEQAEFNTQMTTTKLKWLLHVLFPHFLEFLASSLLSLLSFLRVSKKMRMIFLTSLQPRSDYPPSVFWSQRSGPSPPH